MNQRKSFTYARPFQNKNLEIKINKLKSNMFQRAGRKRAEPCPIRHRLTHVHDPVNSLHGACIITQPGLK